MIPNQANEDSEMVDIQNEEDYNFIRTGSVSLWKFEVMLKVRKLNHFKNVLKLPSNSARDSWTEIKFNLKDFELGINIGIGKNIVKKYIHSPTGSPVAIKFVNLPYSRGDSLRAKFNKIIQEIEIHVKLKKPHLNIVEYYGFCIHPKEDQLLICLELMDISLKHLYYLFHKDKKYFPEELLGTVAVAVVNALDYCKTKLNIMHRDLKPGNILIKWDGHIKLADFGESIIVENSMATTFVGTLPYWPPEKFTKLV